MSARNLLNPARVTAQASRRNWARQIWVVDCRVALGGFPRSRVAIICDGSFVQESLVAQQVATRGGSAANKVFQLAASFNRLPGALLPKIKKIASSFVANAIRKDAARIPKLRTIKKLPLFARAHTPASVGHWGSQEISVDGRVAWLACLVAYKLRPGGAGHNRKQQYELKNQRAEYIIAWDPTRLR